MEQAGVVAGVGLLEYLAKAWINPVAIRQGAQSPIVLDPAALADT